MDKQKLIDAINAKGLSNSLISIYYNIGRALPFRAQRFPDGRVSDWYRSQFVEVHSVKPHGKGGKYGNAYGFYYRNGERANSSDNLETSWCTVDETSPQEIPCGACGSWVLLDILGEQTSEPTKVYELSDILEFGKHKGKTLQSIIQNDFQWVEWAIRNSEHFFCNIDAVIEERKRTIKKITSDDVLPFGKYKGKKIGEVKEIGPTYLNWLKENSSDFIIEV